MKPFLHANSSAKRFGGKPEDYLPIHEFMDSSKAHIADARHRALFHSTFGCFVVERFFGAVAKNSEGKDYSPRDVAEQHCVEDLGHIPTVGDWLADMPLKQWMGGGSPTAIPSASPLAEYKSAGERFASLKAEAAEQFKKELEEAFIASPFQKATWTQYTPGFNDGDPCVFGVGSLYTLHGREESELEEMDPDDADDETWDFQTRDSSNFSSEYDNSDTVSSRAEISETLEDSEELLEAAFGNDKRIAWTRGKPGFEVKDYYCGY